MRSVYAIAKADLLSSWRGFCTQTIQRPLSRLLFLIILPTVVFYSIKLINFIERQPEMFGDSSDGYGSIIAISFTILVIRNAGQTYRKAIRSSLVDTYLSHPISSRKIILGFLISLLFSNLSLILLSTVTILAVINFTNESIFFPSDFINLIFLSTIFAPIFGFLLSIYSSITPFFRKSLYLFVIILPLSSTILFLDQAHTDPSSSFNLFLLSSSTVSILLFLSDKLYIDSILSQQISTRVSKPTPHIFRLGWLNYFLNRKTSALVRKEIVNSLREKDAVGAYISTIFIGLFILFWVYTIGKPTEDLGGESFYPTLLALGIYIGALLQCTLVGASSIGIEGKRLWILKSLPIDSVSVLKGKAISIAILSLPGLLFIWLSTSYFANFSVKVTLFFGEMVILAILINTGLGMWAAGVFADFDSNNRGNPDFLTQFLLMGTSAFITGILMAISGAFLQGNVNFGLIIGASMCFLSYLIYYFGIQGGASAYRSFWSDKYS
tara:strand:- start:1801 stop:3288 length:1488 start_codon:yes stop_codon:yes gene_type:complete